MTEMIKLIESDSPSLKVKLGPCSEDLNRMELKMKLVDHMKYYQGCLLYTSPSPRDRTRSRMPSSA